MPILPNYQAFAGRHWETGTVANALAYQGVIAPHTNQAPTEALLMGISGGAVFGYFTFDYEGYDPILALLTRNTFDPMTTFLDRLAIPRNIQQTTNAAKAEQNLLNALENGEVPIIWADQTLLPYTAKSYDENNWEVLPILVYGVEDETAYISDRAQVGLTVSTEELTTARERIKKDKFRLMTVSAPNWDLLPSAVSKGIWQCIQLYTEAPPKGSVKNFGLAAYQNWAKMLTNTRNKQSWARYFPAGNRFYVGLTWIYLWSMNWGAGQGMERELYADFLDEAALILNKSDLGTVAQQFCTSAAAWRDLATMALPEDVMLLAEARQLMTREHELFIQSGTTHLDEIRQAKNRLCEIKAEVSAEFPMSETEITDLLTQLQSQVLHIHDIEQSAIHDLQTLLS